MSQVRRHRIRTKKLLKELALQPLEYYLESRFLRWAGHITRMDKDRLPRILPIFSRILLEKVGPTRTYLCVTKIIRI